MEIFASENKRSFVRRFDNEGNNFWSDLIASCVKWPRDPISRETSRTDWFLCSRSEIRWAYFWSFRHLAEDILSKELWGTVNSRILIAFVGEIITRSGRSEHVDMFTGMVVGGEVFANRLGRSAYTLWSGVRCLSININRWLRIESWRQVNRPCSRAVGHALRMCLVVGEIILVLKLVLVYIRTENWFRYSVYVLCYK